MANIKAVQIIGEIPFCCAENYEMRQILGTFNSPSCGLRISYPEIAGKRENGMGGFTQYYHFRIHGEEAVSTKFIKRLLQALVNCGADIERVVVRDVENNEPISFKVPNDVQLRYACPLYFEVHDSDKAFLPHELERYLQQVLIIKLDKAAGRFEAGGDDCSVEPEINLSSLEQA